MGNSPRIKNIDCDGLGDGTGLAIMDTGVVKLAEAEL